MRTHCRFLIRLDQQSEEHLVIGLPWPDPVLIATNDKALRAQKSELTSALSKASRARFDALAQGPAQLSAWVRLLKEARAAILRPMRLMFYEHDGQTEARFFAKMQAQKDGSPYHWAIHGALARPPQVSVEDAALALSFAARDLGGVSALGSQIKALGFNESLAFEQTGASLERWELSEALRSAPSGEAMPARARPARL